MKIKIVRKDFCRNNDITNLYIGIHSAGDTCIDNAVRVKIVDSSLSAESCIYFSDTAARIDDSVVLILVYVEVEA